MRNITTEQLAKKVIKGKRQISELTLEQKAALEKSWDVEHAYYSSVLEGSKIDRKKFEELAREIK